MNSQWEKIRAASKCFTFQQQNATCKCEIGAACLAKEAFLHGLVIQSGADQRAVGSGGESQTELVVKLRGGRWR